MAAYLDVSDLEAALSPATVAALFKDDRTSGKPNQQALDMILELACAHVDAALASEFTGSLPLLTPMVQTLLKSAALEFAKAMSFERHPEYVRSFGDNKKVSHWVRGEQIMMDIRSAIKQLPGAAMRNTKAFTYASGPRLFADNTSTGTGQGDF